MRKKWENAVIFLSGAGGYYAIELAWRGRSHWTMALTGGTCLCLLYRLNIRIDKRPIMVKAVAGAGLITAVEFLVGCIVKMCIRDSFYFR